MTRETELQLLTKAYAALQNVLETEKVRE